MFLPLSRQRTDDAHHAAGEDDINHVYAHQRGSERGDHDDVQQHALFLQHARAQIQHNIHDDRRDARLHARQHGGNIGIIRKQRVEIRHQRQNDQRRNDRRQRRHGDARRTRHAPSDENRAVDRNRAGTGLRNSRHVQHVILFEPLQIVHKTPFHQRHDNESAAERKRADGEHGKKQRNQPFFQAHFFQFHKQFLLMGEYDGDVVPQPLPRT